MRGSDETQVGQKGTVTCSGPASTPRKCLIVCNSLDGSGGRGVKLHMPYRRVFQDNCATSNGSSPEFLEFASFTTA